MNLLSTPTPNWSVNTYVTVHTVQRFLFKNYLYLKKFLTVVFYFHIELSAAFSF